MKQSWLPNDPKAAIEYFRKRQEFTLGPGDVHEALRSGQAFVLVDVRGHEKFEREHIPGAVNLPEDEWTMVGVLKQDLVSIVYADSGVDSLATRAAFEIAKAGFPVRVMEGGLLAWRAMGFETSTHLAGANDSEPERPRLDDFTAARMTSHH